MSLRSGPSEIAPGVRFDFSGKTAIVTGGAGGIGLAVVAAFAASGARVVIADTNGREADEKARVIDGGRGLVTSFAVDVTDDRSVAELMKYSNEFGPGIEILVNCAGITSTRIVEETSSQEWKRVLDVNLSGVFTTCREVLPYFAEKKYGRIVNVASVAGKRLSYNASAAYTSSKYGLIGFTKHLAYEVAPVGVRVNAVCPGPVMTPMLQAMSGEEIIASRRADIPNGRISTPEDQAKLILMYSSDLVDFVVGTALDVDGGALLGWYPVESYFERRLAQRDWNGASR
ncbi:MULTISPECIES: SDR family NAD(P)-dependent oxidoreductase [unclassified Cryobacterium]|uniref:SDR family NAD(P)-dependent oxidoreductase n=1 Tax=unclassified Cryobacterium TaxID=2649013 RepID=UPI00106B9F25|nr:MULTISPECIES: SDR family NAD(P)-dependent oxidoreductase [unclassified Cryobacterium]TFD02987.1 SDR family oxidoreductase [Cryobacterium sp. TMT1-66-1]TFD15328.1 SDR family oxidoreductase [Cryobacterium sp. TMT1-2-2]